MEIKTKYDEGDTVIAIIDETISVGVISDIRMDKGKIRYLSENWATWIKEEFLFTGEEAKKKLLDRKKKEISEIKDRYDKIMKTFEAEQEEDTY